MKRIGLLILTSFFVVGLSAQSTFYLTKTDLAIHGNANDDKTLQDFINVKNKTQGVLNMVVVRIEENLPKEWKSSFCVGSHCYPPEVDSATFSMDKWGTDSYQHFYADGVNGTGQYKLKYYNKDFPNEVAILTVTGSTYSVSVENNAVNQVSLNNYPNPFRKSTRIEWSLNRIPNGTLMVTNVLGQPVLSIPVSDKKGSYLLQEPLNSGVYFYSIKDGEKTVITRKMQVVD